MGEKTGKIFKIKQKKEMEKVQKKEMEKVQEKNKKIFVQKDYRKNVWRGQKGLDGTLRDIWAELKNEWYVDIGGKVEIEVIEKNKTDRGRLIIRYEDNDDRRWYVKLGMKEWNRFTGGTEFNKILDGMVADGSLVPMMGFLINPNKVNIEELMEMLRLTIVRYIEGKK